MAALHDGENSLAVFVVFIFNRPSGNEGETNENEVSRLCSLSSNVSQVRLNYQLTFCLSLCFRSHLCPDFCFGIFGATGRGRWFSHTHTGSQTSNNLTSFSASPYPCPCSQTFSRGSSTFCSIAPSFVSVTTSSRHASCCWT